MSEFNPYNQPALPYPGSIERPPLFSLPEAITELEAVCQQSNPGDQSTSLAFTPEELASLPQSVADRLTAMAALVRGAFDVQTAAFKESLALAESDRQEAAQALTEAKQERQMLERERKSAEAARQANEREREKHQKETQALIDKRKEADKEINDAKALRQQLESRLHNVGERERELREAEINAEAGFEAQNRAALTRLEDEAKALRGELATLRRHAQEERERLEAERHAHLMELQTAEARSKAELAEQGRLERVNLESEMASLRQEFEQSRNAIDTERRALRLEQRTLETERLLLEEDRQALDAKVQRLAAAQLERLEHDGKALQARLGQAHALIQELENRLTAHAEANRRFGHLSPEEALEKLRFLEQEKVSLEQKLASSLGADAAERLRTLQMKADQREAENTQLRMHVQQLKQDLTRQQIGATELEALRDHKRTLEAANRLYQGAVTELEARVDNLTAKDKGISPFPSCAALDASPRHQQRTLTHDDIPDLAQFAADLQHRIARDPATGKELFYPERDIRALLGGLAMSKLHILQGISGTGKTSLPMAFARAIGSKAELIEVQAGWRDRQDLIGHFNMFEGKFYESPFLQAVYEAQCPAYADLPYLILLDEMNLSRVEQYFADLLSALEQDEQRRRLMLTTFQVNPAPALFQDGRQLRLPSNVWFVGTANHDETTVEFADKTYDRAHVMELPRQRNRFPIRDVAPMSPLSHRALQGAFDRAQEQYVGDALRAYRFLETELAAFLERRFSVGWGNRLERQMAAFVSVVIGAGGSVGEATDHILVTKVLRKIRDRHDARPEDLRHLRETLETGWHLLDPTHAPERSLALLQEELVRLGSDDGEWT